METDSFLMGAPALRARIDRDSAAFKSFDATSVGAVGFYSKRKIGGKEVRGNVLSASVENVRARRARAARRADTDFVDSCSRRRSPAAASP